MIPAILAAVGEVAAAGSEVFGSQVARAAATQAATQAVEGSAARSAAGTVATQAQGVLESAPGNAKDITLQLKGTQGAARAAPVAAPTVAPPAAAGAATPPPIPPPLPTAPPQAPSQPHAPKSSPLNPANRPMPAETPATQAAAFKAAQQPVPPASALERIGKFTEGVRSKIGEAKQKLDPFQHFLNPPQKSVKEETEGMSFDQRFQRLQQGGSLLSREAVQKATGNENPSLADAVGASEKAEQESREESNKKRAEAQGAGMKAVKAGVGVAGSLASMFGPGIVGFPIWLHKTTEAMEQFSSGILESRRDLSRFNGAIANTFARLDRQSIVHQAAQAQATSGSTRALGDAIMDLRREMQPAITAMITTMNILAGGVADGARFLNYVNSLTPMFQLWTRAAKLAEERFGKRDDTQAFDDFIRRTAQNDWSKPKAFRPGDPH